MEKPKLEALPIWFQQGNCSNLGMDAGIMVPEPGDLDGENQAKVICIECPIKDMCLAWALKNRRNDMGIYGQKTASERSNISRKITRNRNAQTRTN